MDSNATPIAIDNNNNSRVLSNDVYGKIVVIKRSGQDSASFELIDGSYTFGRGVDCDIRIQLLSIADQHCKIGRNELNQAILVKLNNEAVSINNSYLIEEIKILNHNDIITIAERSFRYEYTAEMLARAQLAAHQNFNGGSFPLAVSELPSSPATPKTPFSNQNKLPAMSYGGIGGGSNDLSPKIVPSPIGSAVIDNEITTSPKLSPKVFLVDRDGLSVTPFNLGGTGTASALGTEVVSSTDTDENGDFNDGPQLKDVSFDNVLKSSAYEDSLFINGEHTKNGLVFSEKENDEIEKDTVSEKVSEFSHSIEIAEVFKTIDVAKASGNDEVLKADNSVEVSNVDLIYKVIAPEAPELLVSCSGTVDVKNDVKEVNQLVIHEAPLERVLDIEIPSDKLTAEIIDEHESTKTVESSININKDTDKMAFSDAISVENIIEQGDNDINQICEVFKRAEEFQKSKGGISLSELNADSSIIIKTSSGNEGIIIEQVYAIDKEGVPIKEDEISKQDLIKSGNRVIELSENSQGISEMSALIEDFAPALKQIESSIMEVVENNAMICDLPLPLIKIAEEIEKTHAQALNSSPSELFVNAYDSEIESKTKIETGKTFETGETESSKVWTDDAFVKIESEKAFSDKINDEAAESSCNVVMVDSEIIEDINEVDNDFACVDSVCEESKIVLKEDGDQECTEAAEILNFNESNGVKNINNESDIDYIKESNSGVQDSSNRPFDLIDESTIISPTVNLDKKEEEPNVKKETESSQSQIEISINATISEDLEVAIVEMPNEDEEIAEVEIETISMPETPKSKSKSEFESNEQMCDIYAETEIIADSTPGLIRKSTRVHVTPSVLERVNKKLATSPAVLNEEYNTGTPDSSSNRKRNLRSTGRQVKSRVLKNEPGSPKNRSQKRGFQEKDNEEIDLELSIEMDNSNENNPIKINDNNNNNTPENEKNTPIRRSARSRIIQK